MNVFGRVAKGVFGKGASALDDEQDDSEVESLLHQISDSRHAGDRRDAMSQLSHLLQDNPRAQLAMGAMGLPVLLAVLQEDRDDLELLKGALEVLQLTVALPEAASAAGSRGGAAAQQQQLQQQLEHSPPPALINANLFCRAPDNVLLLLGLLRPEPEGVDDFYARYGALQAMAALLAACQDKLQACVLSSPLGVVALSDLLASPMEVLRNEALLLLVGLCSGCPQIANIAAFEGAFERLLGICGSEGGPGGGNVVVQDAAELMNNLLRDNLANQRLFREMGHIQQLPQLLHFTPPPPAPASAAASAAAGMLGSAGQLGAAAGAAAAAAGSAVGAAVAAAGGAGAAAWPQQVAANYLCVLETAGLLLAAPCSANEEQRAQEDANRRANQQQLGQLGLLPLLAKLGADAGGAPSAAVRAQALFCLGDLVHGHAQLQEQLAGVLVQPRCVRLLSECMRRADGAAQAKQVCCNLLVMLVEWCAGCEPAVAALLAAPSHLPLLVDVVGGRVPGGDANTAGLAAVLLGVCLMFAPGSPISQQQQQQAAANGSLPPPPQFAADAPGSGLIFSQLLDVLLSRVGLSQFFGAIDDMRATTAYQAAKAAQRRPAHVTRTSAAAALDAERSGGGAGSTGGAWGLLSDAVAAAAGPADAAAAAAAAGQCVLQPYDHAFTQLVDEVTSAVQQLTLNAFSGAPAVPQPPPAAAAAGPPPPWQPPPANMPLSSGGVPVGSTAAPQPAAAAAAAGPPAVSGPPPAWQPPQAAAAGAGAAAIPAGAPSGLPPASLPPAAAAAAASAVTGPLAALAAQLQGHSADEKLHSALQLILQLQGSCAELQSRNRALAEDLIRLSQSKPQQLAAAEAAAEGSAAAGSGPRSHGAANGVLGGGSGDAESRVAAQLRASRAEMEAGAMRQQLAAMQERWSGMEAAAAAAREEAEAAAAAAAKAEADLAALSSAYNGLEQHAFEMEEQLRRLQDQQQQQQQQGSAGGGAAGLSEADVAARVQAAIEEERRQRLHAESSPGAAGTAGAGDAEAAIAAAAAEARAAAEAAAEEEMEDLLACLGEEQAKVEVLSSRLEELGEDVDKLLEAVAAAADEEQDDEEGGVHQEDGELL